ncbi:TetR/AcrR family transcriptional regulator [Beduini massiliensis]|uniref:TetR/AcrR family transcriptional regulator n=1 Tax=Beduini massiliensis TaxID=1585974 RepID=UPI00059A8E49|nr:TetR/AcrR family transcriptional regulator [Beduini massiliensis]
MKYNPYQKLTIGAARTLTALQKAMLSLLEAKSFEDITIQELCDSSMLPRATFYNYFDDKNDLLHYCFMVFQKQIDQNIAKNLTTQDHISTLMENCFDFLDQHQKVLQEILKYNSPNQYFINQFRFYLTASMIEAFKNCPKQSHYKVPVEMAAKVYSDAVLTLLEWKYLDNRQCSKKEARAYLGIIVNGITEES